MPIYLTNDTEPTPTPIQRSREILSAGSFSFQDASQTASTLRELWPGLSAQVQKLPGSERYGVAIKL